MVNLSDFTFHKDSWKTSADEVMRKLVLSPTERETELSTSFLR